MLVPKQRSLDAILPKKRIVPVAEKRSILILVSCLSLITILVLTGNLFPDGIVFKAPSYGTFAGGSHVPCRLVANSGDRTFINLDFLIAVKNQDQKVRLKRNMPKIRNEILEAMSSNLSGAISKRDFSVLKKELAAMINKHLSAPVGEIYFEKFAVSNQKKYYYLE